MALLGYKITSGAPAPNITTTLDVAATSPITVDLAGQLATNVLPPYPGGWGRAVNVNSSNTVITIGAWNNIFMGSQPQEAAQFGGMVEIDDSSGQRVRTIAPLGTIAWTTGTSSATQATITIAAPLNVRGILPIGIYRQASSGTALIPIDGTLNAQIASMPDNAIGTWNNNVNAYIAHFPDGFRIPPSTSDVAFWVAYTLTNGVQAGLAAPAIANGYTIVDSGSTLTVTGPSGNPLYVYIFDDNLIKALAAAYPAANVSYNAIAAGTYGAIGALPGPVTGTIGPNSQNL